MHTGTILHTHGIHNANKLLYDGIICYIQARRRSGKSRAATAATTKELNGILLNKQKNKRC